MTIITLNAWPYDNRQDYEIWRLNVLDAMPFEFFTLHYQFMIEKHGVFDYWLTKLFDRNRNCLRAADIICRAYRIYKQSSSFNN